MKKAKKQILKNSKELGFSKTLISGNLKQSSIIFIGLCLAVSLTFLVVNSFLGRKAEAATCGGATVCNCGDTVTSDYTLPADLNCSSVNALLVGADNITIDGNGHSITRILQNTRTVGSGIYVLDHGDVTIQNLTIQGWKSAVEVDGAPSSNINVLNNDFDKNRWAIYFRDITSGTISGNTITNADQYSMYFVSSSNINIDGNTIDAGSYPIVTSVLTSSTITNNTFTKNTYAFQFSGSPGTINNNTFTDNGYGYMSVFNETAPSRLYNLNDTVNFDIDLYDFSHVACPACTYTIATSPAETVSSGQIGNNVTGSFDVSQSGTYSLIMTVTDANNNTEKKDYRYFVDATGNQTTRYYLNPALPVHGQSADNDSRSLVLTAPSSNSELQCDVWIMAAIEQLPDYPLANLNSAALDFWYDMNPDPPPFVPSGTPATIGLERISNRHSTGPYGVHLDVSDNTTFAWTTSYIKQAKTFAALNWPMDYYWNWYNLAVKMYTDTFNDNPYWRTETSADPTYVDLNYTYTTTPIVKDVTDSNINILSATQSDPLDPKTASLVLDGTGSTDLTLDSFDKPFIGYNSRIDAAGTTTVSLTGLSGITTVNNIADMSITPSAGYVDVNINTWNTSGTYYKKWTENGVPGALTANHVINDLNPNTHYYLKVNGVVDSDYTSDGTGQITFNYTGGYSTKTFEVTSSLGGGSNPGVSGFTEDVTFQINNGAATTDNPNVTLNIASQSAQDMLISNDPNFIGADWEPLTNERAWQLTSDLDNKTVYAYFRDANNNTSKLYTAEIILEEVQVQPGQPEKCLPPETANLPTGINAGDLIKVSDITTVYFVSGCDFLRHPFPNEPTYFTWYSDFKNIKIIEPEIISQLPLGDNITVRPGSALVKTYTMPQVYAVEPDSILREIPSPEIAAELYGSNWAKLVIDISDPFFIDYTVGDKITEIKHPNATVIQYQNSSDRYYIENGVKHLITPEIFKADLFLDKFVITNVSPDFFYETGDNWPQLEVGRLLTY